MLKGRRSQALRRSTALLAMVLLAAVLTAGCGKKGPPRLPDSTAPDAVSDLAAVREGEAIVLRWTGFAAAGYQVYRSAEPESEPGCDGCPVLFEPVAKIPLAGEGASPQPLTYREPGLPKTRYRFKVVPFDTQGQLGADSNVVSLKTE